MEGDTEPGVYTTETRMAGAPSDEEAERQVKQMEAQDAVQLAQRLSRQAQVLCNAEIIRKAGNAKFKAEDYMSAKELYSEAMEVITDFEEASKKTEGDMNVDPMKPEAPNIDPEMLAELHAALVSCWLNIAMCGIKTKAYEAAIVACDAAKSIDPNCAKAFFRRGQANRSMKRLGAARSDLLKALELAPTDSAIVQELRAVREQKRTADEVDSQRLAKMVTTGGLYNGVDSGWKHPRVWFEFVLDGFSDEDGNPVYTDRVVIELFTDKAPKTCENFRALCTGEMGTGQESGKPLHYKGSKVLNVQPGFCIQLGDVVNNDGSDGESIYGGYFDDENYKVKHSDAGIVTMVNKGPGTNNSQFGVMLCPAAWCNRKYVAFGRVIEGMQVFRDMEEWPRSDGELLAGCIVKECGQLQPM